jgi:hypothetical protein
LSDGAFRFLRFGQISDLFCGPDFILASLDFAAELARLEVGGLSVTSVKLQAGALCQIDLVELHLNEEITPENISSVDASGTRAWHFRKSNLFVSSLVAAALAERPVGSKLDFSPGFSAFASET